MKTYARASCSDWVSCQRRRAVAMSGRRCSSACTVFFDGEASAIDRPPQRAQGQQGRQGSRNSASVASGWPDQRTSRHLPHARRRGQIWFVSAARSSRSRAAAAPGDRPKPDSPQTAPPRLRLHPAIPGPQHPLPKIQRIRGHGTSLREKYHGRLLLTGTKRSSHVAGAVRSLLRARGAARRVSAVPARPAQ